MSIAVPPPVLPSSQQGRNAGRAPLAELTNKQNQGPPSPKHKTGSVQTQHRASSKSSGSNLGEIVEDSRKSSSGSVIVRRYRKDKLLGKVCASSTKRVCHGRQAHMADIRSRRWHKRL
eukprot:gb/GECG01015160.1/.p1 GENE.gb/GECG01015160.1/~~gb/GECG01015160.1/.p1  ORF type:complete len:118 (+),score=11.62 gb/GECG01015160.1/:1-354(+)